MATANRTDAPRIDEPVAHDGMSDSAHGTLVLMGGAVDAHNEAFKQFLRLAGAAALAELTMAGGEIDEEGNLVEQYIGPGLGLLGFKTIVDTHFQQRRRL